jgi:hypothetical protein
MHLLMQSPSRAVYGLVLECASDQILPCCAALACFLCLCLCTNTVRRCLVMHAPCVARCVTVRLQAWTNWRSCSALHCRVAPCQRLRWQGTCLRPRKLEGHQGQRMTSSTSPPRWATLAGWLAGQLFSWLVGWLDGWSFSCASDRPFTLVRRAGCYFGSGSLACSARALAQPAHHPQYRHCQGNFP